MEPMQDKDFDQLFKQRFESFEVQPSDRSWDNILSDLDGQKKRKRAFPSYWMAAASVVILASAVLWLYRPVEVIRLQGKEDTQTASIEKPAVDDNSKVSTETVAADDDLPVAQETIRKQRAVAVRHGNVARVNSPKHTLAPLVEKVNKVENKIILADRPVIAHEVAKPEIEEKPVVLAQNDAEGEEFNTESEPGRRRIRSVGGLVNFVIAQVDKRDDKIIEFKDGDEGSSVSGINIGPIKFKSRNR